MDVLSRPRQCEYCKQEIPQKSRRFCRVQCKTDWHNQNRTLTPNEVGPCVVCGKHVSRWVSPARQSKESDKNIYCSRTCAGVGRKGANHPGWQGGRLTDKDGYVLVYKPDHPHCSKSGYVREHRLVMEEKIGRYLTPLEVVHHKNDITSDNRPSNLQLYASNREHKSDDYKHRSRNQRGQLISKVNQ